MIKLFWNTHNQKKSNSQNKNIEKEEAVNFKWGIYHKENSDKWVYEILKDIEYETIEEESSLKKEDILIIIDSSPERKIEFYSKLQLICSKIILFHLGDETGSYDLSQIYNKCYYVFRTFCSNRYFNNSKVKCIPIGYKSGITNTNKNNNKYKWAFAGTPHKSSRHDLIFQLSDIKPSFFHKTEKFNTKIIAADELSVIFSSTQFLPCPNGFFHPETYRLYEALQCGCIPIVENAYKYYDRLFPQNPFIKIDKWMEAKLIIKTWNENQIKIKKIECENWWKKYKIDLQKSIKDKIIQ